MSLHKYHYYVDESGQDTEGKLFIVSVVVIDEKKDELRMFCERIEKLSRKYKDNWGEASHTRRLQYIKHIFSGIQFKYCLRYVLFTKTKDYDTATIKGIIETYKWKEQETDAAYIFIDGLTKTKRHRYGAQLRQSGIPVKRIRGIRKEESDALIRLADSIAGFVRDALEGKSTIIKNLFIKAKQSGMLIEIIP